MAGRPMLVLVSTQWEVAVNLKEHLQFLIMMIPTLLLLLAVAVTFAVPAKAAQLRPSVGPEEVVVLPTGSCPAQSAVVR